VLGTATQVMFASETAAVGQVATTPAYDPSSGATADLGVALQTFETMGAGLPFDVPPQAGEPSSIHAADGCGTRQHNPRDGVATVIAVADGEEAFFDANGDGEYDAGEPFVDAGEPFVDQDDSGAWEAGEWFLDVDGDGAYTPGDGAWTASAKIWTQTVIVYTGHPETVPGGGANLLGTRFSDAVVSACTPTAPATAFAVNAEIAGPPRIPPTSRTYGVVASDWNLNRLTSGTEYEAEVTSGGISVSYDGLATYADGLGMFYRYWPCDQAGNCAAQCRAAAADLPCVMTPSLSGFACGVRGTVTVTGGSTPEPGVTAGVRWLVSTPYQVYGTGKVLLGGDVVTGTNN